MKRAFLIVMDSAGIGGAPDAHRFFNDERPDTGANTLGHIAAARPLHMPHLDGLGLGAAAKLASGVMPRGLGREPQGLWGAATEASDGKDTPTGHWELAGVPVPWQWTVFPKTVPAFPADLVAKIAALADTDGILGDCHASGTDIMAALGEKHVQTGWPIVYTSADSVVQIAAHEEAFGLKRLHDLCEAIAPEVHKMRVGRVIARPFTGSVGSFTRTAGRRDWASAPPAATLLDVVSQAGMVTHSIGKIDDIFSNRGIKHRHKGSNDAELADRLLHLADHAEDHSLTFANFVEFDSLYGHRRDIAGYAAALEWFDTVVGRFLGRLREGDLAIFTADHGNDPSWTGTDHTRERVPVVGWGLGAKPVGLVDFVDVGGSVGRYLGVGLANGRPFL